MLHRFDIVHDASPCLVYYTSERKLRDKLRLFEICIGPDLLTQAAFDQIESAAEE